MAIFRNRATQIRTIGDVIKAKRWVVFNCSNFKTIAYVKPETMHLKPNVELEALAKFYPCPQCNYSNGENEKTLVTIYAE